MTNYVERFGLKVAAELAAFIEQDVLPLTAVAPDAFWSGASGVFERFAPENQSLLAKRDQLQAKIDDYYRDGAGKTADGAATTEFLREIGYLVPEPAPFQISTTNVDPEIATMAGPQLVVPGAERAILAERPPMRVGAACMMRFMAPMPCRARRSRVAMMRRAGAR